MPSEGAFKARKPLYALHRFLYQATGGLIGGRGAGRRFVLLTTTGRRSGRLRAVPLTCVQHDGEYVVIAHKAGMDTHPDWYMNLCADPYVRIQLGREHINCHARTAESEERARLWPEITQRFKQYASYQSSTSRLIPVVVLTPAP